MKNRLTNFVTILGNYFRKRRVKILKLLIKEVNSESIKILDVGGSFHFWENLSEHLDFSRIDIVISNIESNSNLGDGCKYIKADARSLPFKNDEFDIVFSNSVIEHIEGDNGVSFKEQVKMAKEVLRVGRYFYVQTPNYWFPFEPHFLLPFFQFYPFIIQVWLVKNFSVGWFDKCKTHLDAENLVKSIKLLTLDDMDKLFPFSNTYKESFLGLTKSITKYGKT